MTDWTLPEGRLWSALDAVVALGPVVGLQHRDPGAPVREFLARARALKALCARTGASLFVNGRVDVALAVGAHLHLPVDAPRPREVRPAFAGRWISAAVHDEAELASAEGADVVVIAPVFRPGSKPGDTRRPLGPAGFSRLATLARVPAWGLGGLDASRAQELGPVAGVAVQSAVLRSDDPATVARRILASLGSEDA